MIVNNVELAATLNMVLARLNTAERHSTDELDVIAQHLRQAANYAEKTARLHRQRAASGGAK